MCGQVSAGDAKGRPQARDSQSHRASSIALPSNKDAIIHCNQPLLYSVGSFATSLTTNVACSK